MFDVLYKKLNMLYESSCDDDVETSHSIDTDVDNDIDEIDNCDNNIYMPYEQIENDVSGDVQISLAQINASNAIDKSNIYNKLDLANIRIDQLDILKEAGLDDNVREQNIISLRNDYESSAWEKIKQSVLNVKSSISKSYSSIISGFKHKVGYYRNIANAINYKISKADTINEISISINKSDINTIKSIISSFSKIVSVVNEIIPEIKNESDVDSALDKYDHMAWTSATVYQYIIGKIINDDYSKVKRNVILDEIDKKLITTETIVINSNNIKNTMSCINDAAVLCDNITKRKNADISDISFDVLLEEIKKTIGLKHADKKMHKYYSYRYLVIKEAHRCIIDIYAAVNRCLDNAVESQKKAIFTALKK